MGALEAMIAQLAEARARLTDAVSRAERTPEIYPTWTFAEVLAHCAGWDVVAFEMLRAHGAGSDSTVAPIPDIDRHNDEMIAARAPFTFDQAANEWITAREALVAALRALTPVRLAQPMPFPWGGTGTAEALVDIWTHHEGSHARDIRRWLERRDPGEMGR